MSAPLQSFTFCELATDEAVHLRIFGFPTKRSDSTYSSIYSESRISDAVEAPPLTKATVLADQLSIVSDSAINVAISNRRRRSSPPILAHDPGGPQDAGHPRRIAPPMRLCSRRSKLTKAKDWQRSGRMMRKLLGLTMGVSRRSTAHALPLLAHPTSTKLQAQVAADQTALATVTAAPLAKFQADLAAFNLSADLNAIIAANPTSTTLATHVASGEWDITTDTTGFSATAVKVQTDTVTLNTDLASAADFDDGNLPEPGRHSLAAMPPPPGAIISGTSARWWLRSPAKARPESWPAVLPSPIRVSPLKFRRSPARSPPTRLQRYRRRHGMTAKPCPALPPPQQ